MVTLFEFLEARSVASVGNECHIRVKRRILKCNLPGPSTAWVPGPTAYLPLRSFLDPHALRLSDKEARKFVFQLPNLTKPWVVTRGYALLPLVALPNLVAIDGHLDWLQGFRGVMLEKLVAIHFASQSGQIREFLGSSKALHWPPLPPPHSRRSGSAPSSNGTRIIVRSLRSCN